jgi:Icc-related predicted phosphoesterase
MKLLVVADDDAVFRNFKSETTDVLIACGDLADGSIIEAARVSASSRIFAVKGNHDTNQSFPPPIVDLHLRVEHCGGLTFGGFHGSWRYKPRGHFLYDQDEVERLLSGFPAVDVFVAHNSPRHLHDRDDEVHLGFDAFSTYIARAQPRLFVHGHQHINRESALGRTKVLGVYGAKLIAV